MPRGVAVSLGSVEKRSLAASRASGSTAERSSRHISGEMRPSSGAPSTPP